MLHIILSLYGGTETLSRLSEEISSSTNALLPKIKVLEEKGLVVGKGGGLPHLHRGYRGREDD